MSTWTEVTGIIICDWHSFSYPNKDQVKKDILVRRYHISKVLNKNLPTGAEYPININIKNYNQIIITGSLREFNSIDIQEKIIPWWDNIIDKLGFIRQAVMSCTCCRKTYIFEKRISHDADLGGSLLKLYGSDPGIFIHTNRKINIK